MATNFEKFQKLLEELFQLDQADLDFGIYRIMNQKRDEVVRFLEKDLLPQVKEAFSQYKSADKAELQKELDKLVKPITDAGMNPDDSPKVQELRQQIADSSVDVTALENEVFSHLFNFFRRYYHEGDFISLRRYKEGVYAIPYEGEEVKLHWANHDQYYVKSSEYFRDYIFTMPSGKRVRVNLVAASTEQDNKKEAPGNERRFVLCNEDPIYEENGELFIRFEYRPDDGKKKQDALNKEAIERVLGVEGFEEWVRELGKPAPTEKNTRRTVLEKHLTQYTARNTLDYFIHKDLGGFLRRELDFYIKNEVMHLDDIEHETVLRVEQYLSKIKVIRRIAHKIIQFLEQLENFQKKLWLKKKFVVETNYCITLDRVPEELYEEIAANDAQREEWVKLFAIDEIKEDLNGPAYSEPLTVEFLKASPLLVLDTQYFEETFKNRLLSHCGNLEKQTDGLLVHGQNFQALNLLQTKYSNKVKCIYIDPPYNTGNDGFLYKDSYEDSSWLSMMQDRLALAYLLLDKTSGSHAISIDDRELYALVSLLRSTELGQTTKTITVKMAEPTGVKMAHVIRFGGIPKLKEHIVLAKPSGVQGLHVEKVPKEKWDNEYNLLVSGISRDEVKHLKDIIEDTARTDTDMKIADEICQRISIRPVQEILAESGIPSAVVGSWKYENAWRIVRTAATTANAKALADEKRDGFPTHCFTVVTPQRRMYIMKAEYDQEAEQPRIRLLFADDYLTVHPGDFWQDVKTTGLDNEGGVELISGKKPEKLLKRVIGMASSSGEIVCDYFLGSGTTTAVAQKMGRKWLGVEVASFFDNLPLTRMKLVLHGEKGGVSEEESWQGGGFLKYIRLESYEDALNNLELKRTQQQASLLDAEDELREQYLLSYMLDVESRGSQSLLNVDSFRNPDQYKLKVERNGETQLVNVDLVETFNWLLGLTVKHLDVIRGVRVVEGTNPEGERVLVLWRNLDEIDNDTLDEWFRKQDYNTKDQEYDLLYVNGDNNLENLRRGDQTWKVRLIEEEFQRLMFDVGDV